MATWADVIQDALQDLGVIQAGETPSAEDQAYCLTRVNRLIDEWRAERLQIYSITRTTLALTSGTSTYTIGPSGDFNIARPIYVEKVRFLDTSMTPNIELPLQPLTDDAYADIAIKTLTSTYPSVYYINPTFPTSTLIFWPVPTSTTLTGVIYCPTALTEASAASDAFSTPPGYRRMITTALALEIAPGFEKEPSPSLIRQAMDSMADVKRANFRMMDMAIDQGALGHAAEWLTRYSIYTGP